jgi:hypothetical protein
MTDLEVFGLLGIALALCIARWRAGVLICLLVGFLQDPLRKITVGEPVYFTVLVGLPLVATLLGARLRNVRISFRPVHSWNRVLRTPLNVFILLVMIQSMAAIIKTGSPAIGAIGALSYLAPLPAILLGYQFSRSERDITRLIKVYLAVGILMLSGIYLSYAGYDWKVLKAVGEGLFIYSVEKGRLDLYSGFLRSPEIAAWHAATSICLLILLALSLRRKAIFKGAAGVLVMFLLGALLLTGRRKFLVEIFMFVSIYALLLIWFLRTAIKSGLIFKSAMLLGVGLAVGSVGYLFAAPGVATTEMRPYYERGLGLQNEATGRATGTTIDSFQWVIAQNGIFGSGAGTGSQGAQHFGGGADIVGYAVEGGLAKVLAELGVPGLVLLLWLVIGFVRYMWSIIMYITHAKDVDPIQAKLIFGLGAFLITNGVVYTIAHQVFGDPFVLIVLGFFLGFVLAMPKMAKSRKTDDRLKAGDRRRTTGDQFSVSGLRSPVSGPPSPAVSGLRSSPVLRRPSISPVAGRPSPVNKP